MKTFFQKYKWRILFWLIFLTIVLYFTPRQSDYYLDADVKQFKNRFLTPLLIWLGVITCILLFSILFFETKSIKQSSLSFMYGCVSVAFFLFIFQDQFLATALFINRQIKMDNLEKAYVVKYMTGEKRTKNNFIPYDVSAKQISIDQKLKNKLYQSDLTQNDTITLIFNRGLFRVAFQSQPFDDN